MLAILGSRVYLRNVHSSCSQARQRDAHLRRGAGTSHSSTLLALGQIVVSPESGLSYRVDRLLGRGGYGQVYLAKRLGRSAAVPARLCVKISPHIDGWLREAYFGQVLDDHPRAIRVFDKFPLVRPSGQTLYCLGTRVRASW